jgi:hypothetical protein
MEGHVANSPWGNFTSYLGATYEYDALNMMRKSITGGVTRSYVYTANDERIGTIEQTGSGIRSDWTIRDSAGQVLRRYSKESNGEWKWQEDYVYRGTEMLAAEVPDHPKTRHFHLDHLGTPRLITGNGGAEISRHTYHPFGEEIAPSPTAREKKQFTGHERYTKNAQRAQLAEDGRLVVTRGTLRPSSAEVAAVNGGRAPVGQHLDHTQEIVLGGAPLARENIAPLDATVNTSNGARVKNAISGLADGTKITRFNYTVLGIGSVFTALIQGRSYGEFKANQEKAHPGFVSVDDMARWVFTGDTRATPPPCTPGNPC